MLENQRAIELAWFFIIIVPVVAVASAKWAGGLLVIPIFMFALIIETLLIGASRELKKDLAKQRERLKECNIEQLEL